MKLAQVITKIPKRKIYFRDNRTGYYYRLLLLVQYIGLIIGIVIGFNVPKYFSREYQLVIVTWILFSASLYIYLRFKAGDSDWLSFDKTFLYAYIYFHYDYLLSYLLGLIEYSNRVFAFSEYANFTTFFISICLFLYLIGYNLAYPPMKKKLNKNLLLEISNYDHNLTTLGKGLIILGFSLILYFIISVGINFLLNRSYGFNIFFSGLFDTSAFTGGKNILAVGLLFLFIDLVQKERNSSIGNIYNLLLLLILVIYVILILVFFSVRSWLILDIFLPAWLVFHYFYKKINFKWLVIAFVLLIVFSFVIEMSRVSNSRNFPGFISAFQNALSESDLVLGNMLSLQWATYKNVNKSIYLIKSRQDLFFGTTLVGDVIAGIPVVGKYLLNGWYEAPSVWLARILEPWYYNNSEGIGFSLPAEIYINFGFWGSCIFFLFFGGICAKLYKQVLIIKPTKLFPIMLYITLVTNVTFAIRQTFSAISRPIVSTMLLLIFITTISKTLFKNRIRKINV